MPPQHFAATTLSRALSKDRRNHVEDREGMVRLRQIVFVQAGEVDPIGGTTGTGFLVGSLAVPIC